MPITSGDIKLLASQVMDDIDQGGGAPTSIVIQDGASNSVFNDISELDRAGGRVNLRKLFASVQTDTTDTYLGGNIIVADTPDDPNVSVTIFSTKSTFDRRQSAADRMESYLAAGAIIDGYLWENHIAGMRSVQLFQRPTANLPVVGQTLVLVQNEGLVTEKLQYVRATKIEAESRTFTEMINGQPVDFEAALVSLEISDALRFDFTGSPASRLFKAKDGATVVRDTIVADAGSYAGAVPITQPVAIGDTGVRAASVYTQLVPAAQAETALIDKSLAGTRTPMTPAGASLSYGVSGNFAAGASLFLLSGVLPGSFSLSGGVTDDGLGNVAWGGAVGGTIDYANGEIRFTRNFGSGNYTVTFTPAAPAFEHAHSTSREVTAENRGYTWIFNLQPTPAPGTVEMTYMVAGRWISLVDDSQGGISGSDPAFGSGSVSYTTGTVALTTGALPDVGSAILAAWGSRVHYEIKAGASANIDTAGVRKTITLPHAPIDPETLTLAWLMGGIQKTAACDALGVVTGYGVTGVFRPKTAVLELLFATAPDPDCNLVASYQWRDPADPEVPALITGSSAIGNGSAFALGQAIEPGSLTLSVNYQISGQAGTAVILSVTSGSLTIQDDGNGSLVVAAGQTLGGYKTPISGQAGTIDYSTGIGSLSTIPGVAVLQYIQHVNTPWQGRPAGVATPTGAITFAIDNSAAATLATTADPFIVPMSSGITVDITKSIIREIVPGSILFRAFGKRYIERNGTVYTDLNANTGAGLAVGTINYSNGQVLLTHWPSNTAYAAAIDACLTRYGDWSASALAIRAPLAPLRPSSMSIFVTDTEGTLHSATSDAAGVVSGDGITGTINYETGVIQLAFGEVVADAYVGFAVDPSTARYNAVAYSYLPLDASVIGIDPVRLPSDGRVPIFRAGGFAVLGHTGEIGPLTVSDGQTVDCGRVRLSRVRVLDANNNAVNTGYTVNLDAGTVSFTDVSGYDQPVMVEHRIEDMAMVSDVQINGDIQFTRQISHAYPSGSMLSSALVTGDLRARLTEVFDQQTWGNAWADEVSGSAASASFNDAAYPIAVSNAGTVTERWAVVFTNTTAFQVIGEHVGVIATGNTSADCAPLNPATSRPYFTLPAAGWGLGWSAGNVLRFNTVGAFLPIWVIRTIQQGQESVTDDSFTLLVRGDVDRP